MLYDFTISPSNFVQPLLHNLHELCFHFFHFIILVPTNKEILQVLSYFSYIHTMHVLRISSSAILAYMLQFNQLICLLIRWDFGELSRLPDYMRPLYKAILKLYIQFEEELAKEGRSYATYYAIEGV